MIYYREVGSLRKHPINKLGDKMKQNLLLITIFLFCFSVAAEESMQCNIGPLKKIYGNTNWLVYSCSDKKTLVIATDTGNPAMPFYFMWYMKDGKYNLHGEGTGNKKYTKAAFEQIKLLSKKKIEEIITKTYLIKSTNAEK